MKVIALIVQLKEQFEILFNDNELLFENFSNKRDIMARVKEKLDGQSHLIRRLHLNRVFYCEDRNAEALKIRLKAHN